MKPVENHMVALPQPELDHEERCDCSFDYDIIDIHDYDEETITFEVKCRDCNKRGYVEGSIKLDYDVEWDDE
jgi:hypothetical protein